MAELSQMVDEGREFRQLDIKDPLRVEKLIKVIESVNDGNTREIDEFIIKLRRRLTLRISGSHKKVNMTEEYHD